MQPARRTAANPGRAGKGRRRASTVRTFGATTAELLRLADWLTEQEVTHVAMESTGVLWKPVFNILEGTCEVILVNPQHFKAVPGRKTDVRDCEWLAQLLEHGLLRGSFIPPQPIRELRDLTRYRKVLIQQRVTEANRVPSSWSPRTSNSGWSPRTSSGPRGAPCSAPCRAANATGPCWPSWRKERCGRSAPPWRTLSPVASPGIMPPCSATSWSTLSFSRRRSPG